MSTLYLVFPTGEKNPSPLPARIGSFYRWLHRWYSETGDLHASTVYYARKQGVSERTVYRWLAKLRTLEYISTEQTPGVERRITPHLEPPKQRRNVRGLSGVRVRGSSSITDACEASTTGTTATVAQVEPEEAPAAVVGPEEREAVSAVADEGVVPAVAAALVRRYGVQLVRVQLDALKHRTVRDRAAALVASIRQNWPIPAVMERKQEEQRKAAQRASERAFRVALDRKREEDRQAALDRLSGLPPEARAAVLDVARRSLQCEKPAAYTLMVGKAGFDAWVQTRALQLLAEGGGIDGR